MAAGNSSLTCPKSMAATSNGVFQGDSPVHFALPLLILQICLVLVLTRAIGVVLKRLRQPRVIAEIIGGILLGPSALGKIPSFTDTIFPHSSLVVLESVADLGLIFFLFMVGLELDLRAMRRTGRQAMTIAAAGITVPFAAGVGVSLVLHRTIVPGGSFGAFVVFMGVAMSITAFPVLARILAERRLLTTDVGQMAMAAAAVNDVVAWILLALAIALSGSRDKSPAIAAWVLLTGLGFVAFMFALVRPVMAAVARHATEHAPVPEIFVAITLAGVLASGFATDAIGIHSIFGAFVFGLVVPKDGPFAELLIHKIEDLVSVLMLPLYFATSGLKTNIGSIHGATSAGLLVLVVATACAGKILGTFAVAKLFRLSSRKSLTLGILMNTKGLVELIVLNIGKDRGVLNDEAFAIMVIMALFTTFITTPLVVALYKPARTPQPYKRRTLYMPPAAGTAAIDQKPGNNNNNNNIIINNNNNIINNINNISNNAEAELRLLACVHGMPNVHAIINVVEAMRGSFAGAGGQRRRPLHMYILHLLEYSERSSAILKLQRIRREGLPFYDKQQQLQQSDDGGRRELQQPPDSVVVAFEAYGQLSKVTVRPMTAISPFEDMHYDICATAADKRISFILLPFHKHSRPNHQPLPPPPASDADQHHHTHHHHHQQHHHHHQEVWETHHSGLRVVNLKVLSHAPCSVGVLVDRGIGAASTFSSSAVNRHVGVLFFGGPDDREALALGYRMAEHPGIKLTVFRFVFGSSGGEQQEHEEPAADDDNPQADNIKHTHHHVSINLPPPAAAGSGENSAAAAGGGHSSRFSINSRFSLGGALEGSHHYMVAPDKIDWAKESKLDEECLALGKAMIGARKKPATASPAPLVGSGSGAHDEESGIKYEERGIGSDLVGAVLEVARGGPEEVLLVGRGRRPSLPVSAAFAGKLHHAEYAELGPVAEALVTAAGVRCSVLAVQQYDPELDEARHDAGSDNVKELAAMPSMKLGAASVVLVTGGSPTAAAAALNPKP